MARVQLVIPDDDQARFLQQARLEGMSFSAWLRVAARDRLQRMRSQRRFGSPGQLQSFFAECDATEGPAREPDWEQHKEAIDRSRRLGLPES